MDIISYSIKKDIIYFNFVSLNGSAEVIKGLIKLLSLSILLLFVSGCSWQQEELSDTTSSISTEIMYDEITEKLNSALPREEKLEFGTIKILGAMVEEGETPQRVTMRVKFVVVTFEIPEGLEGEVTLDCSIVYNTQAKVLYIKDPKVVEIVYADASLIDYLPQKAKDAIGSVVVEQISLLPLYKFSSAFIARYIEDITADKDKLIIKYGK